MNDSRSGHRTVPHTADLRVEAWAPTREGCIAEAVLGAVESFVDASAVRPERSLRCQVAGHSDEDLLVAVLDEVVYLLDTANEVAVEVELDPTEAGADVRFGMCNATRLGAVPKAVSLHELGITRGPRGWVCSVTLDV